MDYFATATVTASSTSTNPTTSNVSHNNKHKPKKKGVGGGGNYCCKLSTDPQSVAARERRHRISDRFKILQSLVPGGAKMDTVSMLDQAIHYVNFLKAQILIHQTLINNNTTTTHHAAADMGHHCRNRQVHYYNEDPAASFYFTRSPDTSYCTHPEEAGGSQLMFPPPDYFVGQAGEGGVRYYS
ncbi:unnamed protein product [Linum tenue]|uniref:BHLH domain-containing protein n=1 Tax=Linum tenue TaxID=586396 RepID=A0AAV0KVL2_9ROSI|nr:unnamed protein product [Linum tenue]